MSETTLINEEVHPGIPSRRALHLITQSILKGYVRHREKWVRGCMFHGLLAKRKRGLSGWFGAREYTEAQCIGLANAAELDQVEFRVKHV